MHQYMTHIMMLYIMLMRLRAFSCVVNILVCFVLFTNKYSRAIY